MPITCLDYGKLNPFGATVGGKRQLAWPVNVFRVTLPKSSTDGVRLNAFERVVLKLIDVGGLCDAESLARETCIPEELVLSVLLRLRDKSFIDEHCQISDVQRDKWSTGARAAEQFATACVFRELVTGRCLPYLHFLSEETPLRQKEEEKSKRLPWDNAYRGAVPTPRDVINAFRGMQKRSMSFGNEVRLPPIQLITIAQQAELHHLDCPIAIQKRDGEFRIADPFGYGYSMILETAFSSLLERDDGIRDWLMQWKGTLSNKVRENSSKVQREPYDNDTNRARYPKLVRNLNAHRERERQHRSIQQLHGAMEWALFYSCAHGAYAPAVQKLKLSMQSEHSALLEKAAEDLSLVLPPDGLRPVREGKLEDFLGAKAELGTVLSLSLLMAASDRGHPLRRIASAYPDFVLRLFDLKRERDEFAHGTSKTRRTDIELLVETFVRDVLSILLPSIRFAASTAAAVEPDAFSDLLMDARSSLQNEFGFALYNRLGSNFQDRLISAEQFSLSCNDGDDALGFVCDLYAALQSAFRRVLSAASPPDIRDAEFISRAQQIVTECGLGRLPDCLRTAKQSSVRQALQGNDQSLQSCVVAFLLVSDGDTLSTIADKYPNFLASVAHIADRRGHGNEPLPSTADEIHALRAAAFAIIKALLEN